MKAETLEVNYIVCLQFDVEKVEKALDINWGEVETWYVKYANLIVTMEDGRVLKMEGPDMSNHYDWKHPEKLEEIDSDGYAEEVSQ